MAVNTNPTTENGYDIFSKTEEWFDNHNEERLNILAIRDSDERYAKAVGFFRNFLSALSEWESVNKAVNSKQCD